MGHCVAEAYTMEFGICQCHTKLYCIHIPDMNIAW